MGDRRPEVLFVCVHNAGRSQMAAALLAHHAAGRVVVRSAGTAPAESINPAVVEAMAEVGIDLQAGGAVPKLLDDAAVEASDVVITMGCGDTCPFYPGKRYLDWPLDDPAGQGVDTVRPIRDEIDRLVRGLLAELDGEVAAALPDTGAEPLAHRIEPTDPVVEFYWRPGCPFCMALGRSLRRKRVTVTKRNIWEDPEAAALVRAAAGGNETVPTVNVGGTFLVNPSAREVVDLVEREAPGAVGPTNRRWLRRHRPG